MGIGTLNQTLRMPISLRLETWEEQEEEWEVRESLLLHSILSRSGTCLHRQEPVRFLR